MGRTRFRSAVRIERAGPADLMFAALQAGAAPHQFGAVLVLEPGDGFDVDVVTMALADRVRAVPRLRQRLVTVPPGCGRPVWVDDAGFAIDRHIEQVSCPSPGDEPALLEVAAKLVMRRLPTDRPPWQAAVVTGLAAGRIALILVVQHALADGIGSLAVLGALVDGEAPTVRRPFPIPPPSMCRLAVDALLSRASGVPRMPVRIRAGFDRMWKSHAPRIGRAAGCSLLAATGEQRAVAVARARLADVRSVAHRHRATVNDVVLSAIGGALHSCLERRGEEVDTIVAGVPVATRNTATVQDLGNQLGEVRAPIPTVGDPVQRLEHVAKVMRSRKKTAFGLNTASQVVRLIAAVGVYDWYMRRQRYLHTVVTDVRGPARPLTFCGAPITEVLPLTAAGGNVTVSFAALSYAGTLAISVIADPDAMPDLIDTTAALQAELDMLTGAESFPSGSRHLAARPGP
jgi:diacylglycerol O-acyltransferase